MSSPLDAKYVDDAERELGVKFPGSFRNRMVEENGGQVSTGSECWRLYPFRDASDRKRLVRTCNDIVRETAQAKQWQDFPQEAVAIGSNDSGDQLVFLPQPNSSGYLGDGVYWWDHETGHVRKVADDFSELA